MPAPVSVEVFIARGAFFPRVIHYLCLQGFVFVQVGIHEQTIYLYPPIHLPMPSVSDGTLGVVSFRVVSSLNCSFAPQCHLVQSRDLYRRSRALNMGVESTCFYGVYCILLPSRRVFLLFLSARIWRWHW